MGRLLILLVAMIIFLPSIFSRPVRVGDGSEYYAMALTLANTHRPFMNQASWVYYDELYRSNVIPGINSAQDLKAYTLQTPARSGEDFNHFWFYSLGAALLAEAADYSGFEIPLHSAFMVFHFFLLLLLLYTAQRHFGWVGFVSAALLTVLSPAFWYIDKVHTEFFTYCLTTTSVIFFVKKRYIPSALCLALAGTQNVSFAALSLFPLVISIFSLGRRFWHIPSILLTGLILLVNALHPAYYLLRYSVPSPQLLSGVAAPGLNFSHMFIWLLDPDVGLLPNWPLGILLGFFAIYLLIRRRLESSSRLWLGFCLVFLAVSLLAQSATINLNSGASPGLARYGTWYLSLFFPALLLSLRFSRKSHCGALTVVMVVLLAGIFSARNFLPSRVFAAHCQPSTVSYWLQKNLPGLYNPPAEIFAERYGGVCEPIQARQNTAVIGPDCRKLLLLNPHLDGQFTITGAAGCKLDFEKVSALVTAKVVSGEWPVVTNFQLLSYDEMHANEIILEPGQWYSFGYGETFSQALAKNYRNWTQLEEWGAWSVGYRARLSLPCPTNASNMDNVILVVDLQPFVSDGHPELTVEIELDRHGVWSGSLQESTVLKFPLPQGTCTTRDEMSMRITLQNPISRAALGISGDKRKLGIGLLQLKYLTQ